MLERRLDDQTRGDSRVRRAVANRLRAGGNQPADIHHALMGLADRGGASTIVTTNFDLLLERAAKRRSSSIQTYSLGSIPRPTRQADFAGVLHIHGALDPNPDRLSELVLSDQDFGEFYLRRRVVCCERPER
ncbi:SIR2 family protein [Mesorhizobium captivum]|uniref:SIR2 family protein n=1 Tax=Mesorhizobium captivum TaxID=3072319 RepID=UPI003D3132C0